MGVMDAFVADRSEQRRGEDAMAVGTDDQPMTQQPGLLRGCDQYGRG